MAAGLREIKRRIKSVRSTMQITKAMEMVAAARLKRAQARAVHMRGNVTMLNENISRIAALLPDAKNFAAFFNPKPDTENTVGVIIFSADRGLCGSYNANVMRFAQHSIKRFRSEGKHVLMFAVGKKIQNFLIKNESRKDVMIYPLPLRPAYKDLKNIMKDLIARYEGGEFGSLLCVYTKFLSTTRYEVTEDTLLPFDASSSGEREKIIVEPEAEKLLPDLMAGYLYGKLFLCYAESYASEQAARMLAMRNANDAAADMIDSLTLSYNKARQSGITREILEVVSGAEALKG